MQTDEKKSFYFIFHFFSLKYHIYFHALKDIGYCKHQDSFDIAAHVFLKLIPVDLSS